MDLQNEILTIDDLAGLLKMNRRQIYEMTSNQVEAGISPFGRPAALTEGEHLYSET